MRLLYPSNPLRGREPEEQYAEEHNAALRSGFGLSLFSFEEFMGGTFLSRPALTRGEPVVYRGWMMKPLEYSKLHRAISDSGASALTSPLEYELCHYLPRWYPALKELTPETHFFSESDDIAGRLRDLGWQGCFLKDYVKSLTTGAGSVVRNLSEIPAVIAKMKTYRGEVEGGICARWLEELDLDTEDRYFVFRGKCFGRAGEVPAIVKAAAERISSPFYSVDTVRRRDGTIRIVELGDGQVSDRKRWTAEQFLAILNDG